MNEQECCRNWDGVGRRVASRSPEGLVCTRYQVAMLIVKVYLDSSTEPIVSQLSKRIGKYAQCFVPEHQRIPHGAAGVPK